MPGKRWKVGYKLRERVFRRDEYTCRGCGAEDLSAASLEVDHIHPVALGGRTVFGNLQALCRSCNSAKRADPRWVSPLMRQRLRARVGLPS